MSCSISEPLSEEEERRIIVDRYSKGREKMLSQIDEWEDPKFELYHLTDRYGFIHKEKLPDRLSQYEQKVRHHEASRSEKWTKMLKNWKSYVGSEKLRKRVFKGIPNQVRGQAWMLLMDVPRVKAEQEGRYQVMLAWGLENSRDVKQIDLDVNRTFRNNLMFKDRYDIKQQELFRILVAYSVYNSEIGYCQGMSQIAALLLMYLPSEEDVFWALDRLMTAEKYAMHGFFIPGFPKLSRFARHHDLVLKKYLPKVFKHFKKFDIDSTLYTLKWFFQCFLDRVPFSLTLRIWDCFMLDGEVILTCMSYTLLKLHKRNVLKKEMEHLIEFLQIDLEKDFGYHDDEAINALDESISELRKHRMHLPKEFAPESEKPTKPFGWLLSADNISLSTSMAESVVGSIVLRPDGTSLSRASSRSSMSDIADNQKSATDQVTHLSKVITETMESLSSAEVNPDHKVTHHVTFTEASPVMLSPPEVASEEDFNEDVIANDQVETFIDNNRSPSPRPDDLEVPQTILTSLSDLAIDGRMPFIESPVGTITSPVSVLVALRDGCASDKEFMQEWPDGRSSKSPSKSSKTPDRRSSEERDSPVTRRTSIPRLRSPKSSSPSTPSTHHPMSKGDLHHHPPKSHIPTIRSGLRSPPSGTTHQIFHHKVESVTISVGLGQSTMESDVQNEQVSEADVVRTRIFVPYDENGSPGQTSNGQTKKGRSHIPIRNALPTVDT